LSPLAEVCEDTYRLSGPANPLAVASQHWHSVAVADGFFDERMANRYDALSGDMFDPGVVDPAVNFLAELAGNGPALEMGVGTGRVALPLSQRGITVEEIDLSPAMVVRLRQKPGGDAIAVTIGDFATTTLDSAFRLVYLVFNTIMNLTTQDQQVACFGNAAQHLEPGSRYHSATSGQRSWTSWHEWLG
jgi:hypothetical protein